LSDFDVLIIGGGPAGISASIWAVDVALSALLIEKNETVGGQLHSIYNPINNYPGILMRNGSEMYSAMRSHLDAAKVKTTFGGVVRADLARMAVQLADGSSHAARAIVIATGVRRRELGVTGEPEFAGKGILRSGSEARNKVAGKKVVVIGGGDAAAENALILSDAAEHVSLIHRGTQLSARKQFTDELSKRPNIHVLLSTKVTEIIGDDDVNGVRIVDRRGESTMPTDNVVIRIGVEPNNGLFAGQVVCDERNYIRTDTNCQTSLPLVYAVGDVASPLSPTIATAVGMGATAIKNIYSVLNEGAR
jgi:thioredoxin reductase (NADPH)